MRKLIGVCCLCLLLTQGSVAQVIQLPSYRVFSIQTSGVVPDQGTAVVGGGARCTPSRFTSGGPLFSSTRFASQSGSSQMQVRSQILDHAAIDAKLLAEARAQGMGSPQGSSSERKLRRRVSRMSQAIHRAVEDDWGYSSVAELRRGARKWSV